MMGKWVNTVELVQPSTLNEIVLDGTAAMIGMSYGASSYVARLISSQVTTAGIIGIGSNTFSIASSALPTNDNNRLILATIPFYNDNGNAVCLVEISVYGQYSSSLGLRVWNPDKTSTYFTGTYLATETGSHKAFALVYAGRTIGVLIQGNSLDSGFDTTRGSSYLGVSIPAIVNNLGNADYKTSEISEQYGIPSKEGGYTGGTFDDSSDTISLPAVPLAGVSSAGFVNIYNPSAGALQQFGSELFPNLSFTPVSQGGSPASVTDALVAMAQVLVDFGNQIPQMIDMYINSNLINYVIDCHIIPVAPAVSGAAQIKVGFKTFTASVPVVTSDYVDFDCGSLNIGEYYANFIDYAPYTRAKLFLPFVGFVDLAPEYFQSGTLQVIYRFNIIDGSFMAFVISTSSKSKLSNSVIAQYGGNACVHIPITGLNYSSMVSGVVGAVQAVASAQPGAGMAAQAVNSAIDIANSKPPFQQSNGYNATTSFLGVRKPYLIIERSVSNFSRDYDNENGIPSNISRSFASLSGFTAASNVHLDGIAGATSEDLEEIKRLLSEGVIF